jgi:Phage tail lysozyme
LADNSPYFIGDSIAQGLQNAAHGQGNTKVGRSPAAVLEAINNAPDLTGRRIVLSTGLSNNPQDIASVKAQFAALVAKGVSPSNISVVGLGNRFDSLNPTLSSLASSQGANFTGGFQAGADGVHPASYGTTLHSVFTPSPSGGQSTAPSTNTGTNMAEASQDRRTILFNAFTSMGLNPQQALGAMAGLSGESGATFNASAYNPNDPGGSVGIGQWNQARRAALVNYASRMGTSPNDFNTQVGYLKQELTSPNTPTYQGGVLDALKSAGSTADAANVWTGQFERPTVNNYKARLANLPAIGSVDSSGNFVPGKGTAVASTDTTPGTTLNTNPAASAAPAAAPAAAPSAASQFAQGDIAGGLGTMAKQGDIGKLAQAVKPQQQQITPMQAPNLGIHQPNPQAAALLASLVPQQQGTTLQHPSVPGAPLGALGMPSLGMMGMGGMYPYGMMG